MERPMNRAASRLLCVAKHIRPSGMDKVIASQPFKTDTAGKSPITDKKDCDCDCHKSSVKNKIGGAFLGGAGLLAGATGGLMILGFGSPGIMAGTVASSMMSLATSYGVGAGVVGAAQSAGMLGFGAVTKAVLVTSGATVGWKVLRRRGCDCDRKDCDRKS